MLDRRTTLLLLSLIPVACQTPAGQAPPPLSEPYRHVRELAEGVYTYEYAVAGDVVTTVSMFVITDEGVLVADGQGNPAETERLLAAIAQIGDLPVTHVVICSDHGDHTGGNVAFPGDTEFLGHPAAQTALQITAMRPDRDLDAPPVMLATRLIHEREVLSLGGKKIEIIFFGRGHTAGDLAVHLPEDRILFMSEAYNDRVFPLMRSGYPSEWVDVLDMAQDVDVDTYVAGHGIRGSIDYSPEGLEAYLTATQQVITEATRLHSAGLSVENAAAQADFGALAEHADYSSQAARAIQRVFMELNGELPPR
jgi:glyoxylase-like metal-dependent hydrolase (beta-lactamase superfamily II)